MRTGNVVLIVGILLCYNPIPILADTSDMIMSEIAKVRDSRMALKAARP